MGVLVQQKGGIVLAILCNLFWRALERLVSLFYKVVLFHEESGPAGPRGVPMCDLRACTSITNSILFTSRVPAHAWAGVVHSQLSPAQPIPEFQISHAQNSHNQSRNSNA